MKRLCWAPALCAVLLLAADPAGAQAPPPDGLRQPPSLEKLALDYDLYVLPGANGANRATTVNSDEAKRAAARGVVGLDPDEDGAAPRSGDLDPGYRPGAGTQENPPALVQTDRAADCTGCAVRCRRTRGWLDTIKAGGWLQAGITMNSQDPSNRFNGPVLTNDRAGELQMNQLWLYLERPVDTGGCGWDLGGRFDATYGTDWRCLDSLGLDERINAPDQFYGLTLAQFYAEVGYNDLTVKLGHFMPYFGYEVVPAVGNFFYSHSYALGYSEPLLVTGMLADYALTDQWSIQAGFHRGYNMFEDNNDDLDFLGGLAWTSRDQRDKLTFKLDNGPQDPAGACNRFVYSFVWEHQFDERWRYALHHVLGNENDTGRAGQDDNWYGLTHYLFYTINDRWSAGCRVEWYRDTAGAQVAGLGNNYPGRGWPGRRGFEGDFVGLTFGVNWRPHANVVLRPELRWDWYNGTTNVDGQWPFDDGHKSHQFLLSADMIVRF